MRGNVGRDLSSGTWSACRSGKQAHSVSALFGRHWITLKTGVLTEWYVTQHVKARERDASLALFSESQSEVTNERH